MLNTQPDVISLWCFSYDHCAELLLWLGFMLNTQPDVISLWCFSCDHCAELLLWLGAVRPDVFMLNTEPDVISFWCFSCDHCAELLLRLGAVRWGLHAEHTTWCNISLVFQLWSLCWTPTLAGRCAPRASCWTTTWWRWLAPWLAPAVPSSPTSCVSPWTGTST